MNSTSRKFAVILLAFVIIGSFSCNRGLNKRKELLIGDWILIPSEVNWHPGFRLTQDSIFPLFEQSGFLSIMQHFGEPFQLTKDI